MMSKPQHDGQQTDYAFFFDIDGTLAPLQDMPNAVQIPATVIEQLIDLSKLSDGAVAFVSGRPLNQIDHLTQPLRGAAAGTHGAEIRTLDGQHLGASADTQQLRAIEQQLALHTDSMDGVWIEKKGVAFAVHYRQAPTAQQVLHQIVQRIVDGYPAFTVQAGKCVWEIKPRGYDKGKAINYLMMTPPFIGRIPVFIGDDVTDEAGFHIVNQQQGISIKIGAGDSEATHRFAEVEQLYRWIGNLLNNKITLQTMRSV
ncbi:trehalose-phosphatase [Rosenbergiella australiborealis]|uniref:trehalose-phosphatase n=1 Tax=Rosenbergiella australiborealis TaxID=1544696 RepID=UPI001F4E4F1E|nr:trehalose-phosphatase [Rosenbergiella australiborealis]